MTQKQLIGAVVVAVVIVNLLGFALFLKSRNSAPPAVVATPTPVVAVRDEEVEAEQNARARRAAGVAALEAGDYDKALINFTEAKALAGSKAKVDELLKVTEDLRRRGAEKAAAAPEEAPPPVVAVAKPAPRGKSTRTTERRVEPRPVEVRPEPVPAPAPAPLIENGTLLISTTPRGLLVHVDGQAMDLTPMRTPMKAGVHRVALFDADRKVYETTVVVEEGQVATIVRDLTAELAPKEPVAAPTRVVEPAPEPKVEPKKVAAVELKKVDKVDPKPVEPTPVVAPVSVPAPPKKGGLELTSPGLYGEIWVNGRPAGFPPVTIEDLAVGPVKIEVRVNGAVKRSTTAVVEAGLIKPVRVVR